MKQKKGECYLNIDYIINSDYMYILTAISFAGVVFNILKSKWCFVFWMFTNMVWAAVNFYIDMPAQAIMFVAYFILSLIGFIKWLVEGKKGARNDIKRNQKN